MPMYPDIEPIAASGALYAPWIQTNVSVVTLTVRAGTVTAFVRGGERVCATQIAELINRVTPVSHHHQLCQAQSMHREHRRKQRR